MFVKSVGTELTFGYLNISNLAQQSHEGCSQVNNSTQSFLIYEAATAFV